MSPEDQKKWGTAALVAVGLVIAYLVVLKPLMTSDEPSKAEVRTACAGVGASSAALISKWENSGRLGTAAKIAAAMGLATCADRFGSGQ